jgi:hypothetical protein
MRLRSFYIAAVSALLATGANAQFADTLNGHITTNLSISGEWVLGGIVYVDSGVTFTILPGTVVRGVTGMQDAMGGLVVGRGAKINANGSKENPIIMTAITDNLNDPYDC